MGGGMSRLTIRKNDIALIEEIEYEPCGEVCDRTSCFDCPIGKVVEKLAHYEDLEEQGRLIELPCEKVYRIIDYDSPKYAFVDSIPIEMMPIYDLKNIDNGNIFFSTKEEAEAKLKELKGE